MGEEAYALGTRVTQNDIARIANVSQATVSRVLAGDDRVDETIRRRVAEAIEDRNYRPDVRARSLRNRKTGLVGLVVNRPHGGLANDPFFASLFAAIIETLSDKPYHLCLDMASSDTRQAALYDEMLRSRRVDGLILVESEVRDQRVRRLHAEGFPFVLIGNPLAAAEIYSVDNDNVLAGEIATRHLLDEGYGRVGILAGRRGITVSDERVAGYQRAVRGRQAEHMIWHSDFGPAAARATALELLGRDERPDALIVLDDFMASGVVLAAREHRLRIPADLGLVGFSDSILCDLVEGGLTSVNLAIPELVREACERLLCVVEGRPIAGETRAIVPCELRVRGSSRRTGEVAR